MHHNRKPSMEEPPIWTYAGERLDVPNFDRPET
jgi:hypothetical protein